MAEFGYLVYYKEHPADKAMNMRNHGTSGYEKLPKRQRGTSVCTTLSPVMEDETMEVQKKSKRRFSLDALFSKKKNKQMAKSKDNGKRGSVDSTCSSSSEYENGTLSPESRSRKPSVNEADLTGYCFT